MAATAMRKVYQAIPFCFSEQLLQPFHNPSSCLGNNQSGVAEAWQREMYSGRVVGNYKRNQFNELPPSMKNVYKSGKWPDTNNNLLKACLPAHNALQSQVVLGNTVAPAIKPFFPPYVATFLIYCCYPHNLYALSGDLANNSLLRTENGVAFLLQNHNSITKQCFISQTRRAPFLKTCHLFWHDHAAWKREWRLAYLRPLDKS